MCGKSASPMSIWEAKKERVLSASFVHTNGAAALPGADGAVVLAVGPPGGAASERAGEAVTAFAAGVVLVESLNLTSASIVLWNCISETMAGCELLGGAARARSLSNSGCTYVSMIHLPTGGELEGLTVLLFDVVPTRARKWSRWVIYRGLLVRCIKKDRESVPSQKRSSLPSMH